MPPPLPRQRARDVGLSFGSLPTGPLDAITDVPGVRIGQVTIWHDEPAGVARTGVTAIVPDDPGDMHRRPMAAGTAVLNGAGELTGSIEIVERGILETPIVLTGTPAVGRAYDAIVDLMIEAGADEVVIPVAGECDDTWLDDIRRRWVTVEHVREAIAVATDGPVSEGVVGAGTGMVTMGHKGGIGTASRVIEGLGTIGVLLLCNFGGMRLLRLGGMPVGETLAAERDAAPTLDGGGSCIGVVVTDIPLDARQLTRVARRVGLGLARVGSVAHNGSGDIFCRRLDHEPAAARGVRSGLDRSRRRRLAQRHLHRRRRCHRGVRHQRTVRRRHRHRRRRSHRSGPSRRPRPVPARPEIRGHR